MRVWWGWRLVLRGDKFLAWLLVLIEILLIKKRVIIKSYLVDTDGPNFVFVPARNGGDVTSSGHRLIQTHDTYRGLDPTQVACVVWVFHQITVRMRPHVTVVT